jgi:hypothetical protein
VVITLPATANSGDFVSVTGESANNWTLAQNSGQTVFTSGMQGSTAPGTVWTPRLAPKVWHWIASDATGNVILAGEGGGRLNTSSDGGNTWTTGNSPNSIWISADMTAGGERMVAVQYGGGMYASTDHGATWTQLASSNPAVNLSGQAYESVTISQDGRRIVALVQGGPIFVSGDGGATWAQGTTGSPAATLTGWWRAVDGSADGMNLIAADQNGPVYRSSDGGFSWSQIAVTVGGVTAPDNWYRVKMSNDGRTIALVGNSFGGVNAGRGIYVSRDGGASWSRPISLVADYTAAAVSGDGQVITVTVSNPNPNRPAGTVARASGRVLRSTDGGASFTTLATPASDTDWRAVGMSADGNQITVAAGMVETGEAGQLYTSLGNRTSIGTAGSITGSQGQTAELVYLGNGQFSVRSSGGGAFTIR